MTAVAGGFRTTVNYNNKAQDHSVDSYSAFADNQYYQFTTLDPRLTPAYYWSPPMLVRVGHEPTVSS